MSRFSTSLGPVVVLAAAAAATLATMTGIGDPTSRAPVRAPETAAAAELAPATFMSEQFEAQKRSANAEDLPAQF
ncbi:hypothetical protein [Ramlibacter sp.]|uniref:hypothetical protein n=1 Tax=Ramlibacter sp. TaxID=1917967 RepID=UPI002C005AA2|nr:hypothetical protein [Ramlibacter sp.]HWI84313.1 hypothetical protein [Ramlibacter sp.]